MNLIAETRISCVIKVVQVRIRNVFILFITYDASLTTMHNMI